MEGLRDKKNRDKYIYIYKTNNVIKKRGLERKKEVKMKWKKVNILQIITLTKITQIY